MREPRDGATTIRPMSAGDIAAAVALHRAAFPRFFLSELGPRFLRELYRGFLSAGGVAMVAEADGGRLVGVAAGTCQPSGFFFRLLCRRWWAFALAACPLVLRRPRVASRVARAVRYRGDVPGEPGGALLSTICVAPQARGLGVGTELVRAFVRQARARGSSYVYLLAEAEDEGVSRFYQRAGFGVQDVLTTPEGRRMNRYVLPLERAAAPAGAAAQGLRG